MTWRTDGYYKPWQLEVLHAVSDQFSVYIFFHDGTYFSEWRWLDDETAVKTARDLSRRPVCSLPDLVEAIRIVDGGDFTVFEWKPVEGVTFPKLTERKEPSNG